MDVGALTTESPFEDYLCDMASLKEIPILGTFEVTPSCNMDCKMCYVRMKPEDVNRLGGLKPASYWIELAKECMDAGMLFLLITGGEPLIYPGFKEILAAVQKMGLFVTLNTNGTLINEEWAQFFHDHMIRRLNITIYGKDDETYGRLCNNPRGFTQLSNAIALLKKYDVQVRLNCTLTKENYEQLPDFQRIAEEWGLPIEITYYLFPPNRKIYDVNYEEHRMTPQQAAKCAFDIHTYRLSPEEKQEVIQKKFDKINHPEQERRVKKGFTCRAANSSFWINWKGELGSCGIMNEPKKNLQEISFSKAWEELKQDVMQIQLSEKCYLCKYSDLCSHCAAGEVAEHGEFGDSPKYQCDFTEAYVKLLEEAIER